jgi:hypothetical protein
VPRKSSATGSAQKDTRMDGSERGTGLHPGGSVYGDGRRDGEMQEEAFVRSSGRSRSGAVFILTSSGLRRIGLRSGLNQPNSDGEGFFSAILGESSTGKTLSTSSTRTTFTSSGFCSPWSSKSRGPRRASRSVSERRGEIGSLWMSAHYTCLVSQQAMAWGRWW